MKYLKELTINSIEIQKSHFHALLYPLNNQEDIPLLIDDAKKRYPKATHYCSASIFNKSLMTINDDGEPQRTAGIPILEVLKHHELNNVLCVVVRYFGGIKLGAPGLVRAYTNATVNVVLSSKFYQKFQVPVRKITFPYHLIGEIDYLLNGNVIIKEKDFQENVTYTIVFYPSDESILKNYEHLLIDSNSLPDEDVFIELN